jgi:DNA-binding CsgD family transcriptional regulator
MASAIDRALPAGDARRALAAFEAIAAADRAPADFVHQALDQLAELVGSDLTTLSLCDLRRQTRRVIGRPGEAISARDCAAFDRHFRDHPLVRFHSSHSHGPTQRITDCVSLADFRASALFADYYRPIGIAHAMALPLRIDHATVISVVFNRTRAAFADRDRAAADILRRPLSALYRSLMAREAMRLEQASLHAIAARAGWHAARVASDGRLRDMPAASAALLRFFFHDAPGGTAGELPAALRRWLGQRSLNWGLDRLLAAATPYIAERGGWRLTIHFIADTATPECGQLIMRRERIALAPATLATLPLTAREREVLAILASGKTNEEIAGLLAISARTVQKHLEHIFAKLGVETRMAAALCALAAADTPSA